MQKWKFFELAVKMFVILMKYIQNFEIGFKQSKYLMNMNLNIIY